MKKSRLFLDDKLPVEMFFDDSLGEFHVVKSYDEFVNFLLEHGLPEFISLDTDLGLNEFGRVARDGYDVAKWLVMESGFDLEKIEIQVHGTEPESTRKQILSMVSIASTTARSIVLRSPIGSSENQTTHEPSLVFVLTSQDISVSPQRLVLGQGTILIGRHADCDLQINDRQVSGRHAQISCENECYYLVDMGSTNGTYLNKELIDQPTKLEENCEIKISDSILRFSSNDQHVRPLGSAGPSCSVGAEESNSTDEDISPLLPTAQDRFSDHQSRIEKFRKSSSRPLNSHEPIEFAAFSPTTVLSGATFILDIWTYAADQFTDVVSKAKEVEREAVVGRKSGSVLSRGELLEFKISSNDLVIEDLNDTVVWHGIPANVSFIVQVPVGIGKASASGTITISCAGFAISKLRFLIPIADVGGADSVQCLSSEAFYPRNAFASYASEDRVEVMSRIQGIKKIAPEMDVFLDVLSIRSGANWLEQLEQHVPSKDIFYLFWSKAAAQSEWVAREWKIALEARGLEYIDPVPLDEPDLVPPPQELNSLHFSDAYLGYINYQKLKSKQTESH